MPHVLPFERRAVLFRQWVEAERGRCAALRTPIRIRRTHVVEDTLAALGSCDVAVLKSRWAIHFVNEQGLDEAGIDEFGLFRSAPRRPESRAPRCCLVSFVWAIPGGVYGVAWL